MAFPENIETAYQAFAKRHGMDPNKSSTKEAFLAHQVLLHRNLTEFLAVQSWRGERKILVGGAQDIQLDAIVVCIDDKPIRPDDDLRELETALTEGETPAISFVFVQATSEESSGKRLSHKISSFSDGVLAFFLNDGTDSTGINATIMEWIVLKKRIFDLLKENDASGLCECAMYFVWPKLLQSDDNIALVSATAKRKIALLGDVFARVEFHAFDRRRIEAIIEATELERRTALTPQCELDVPIANFMRLPVPSQVAANYVGYLTASQLLGLITESEVDPPSLNLKHGIFSRNIRSYLGQSQRINSAMSQTLKDLAERSEFGLRSNGIAILAESHAETSLAQLHLAGAQISNGCQTCHVLFENRQLLDGGVGDEICIPVKIIVTDSRDIAGRTALGLNRQTPIDEARLFTGAEVVDALAWRFSDPATPIENQALFERRQDEFADASAEQRPRVLTPYMLARAYASVFLPRPETVNNQGKQPLIDQIRNEKIFGRNQDIAPYFLCGIMVLRAKEALKANANTKAWDRYPAKNLLLYAMRLIAERRSAAGNRPDDLESEAGKTYVARLGEVLLNPAMARAAADEAIRCVIMATSDARTRLNSKNAGTAALAEKVKERAIRATI